MAMSGKGVARKGQGSGKGVPREWQGGGGGGEGGGEEGGRGSRLLARGALIDPLLDCAHLEKAPLVEIAVAGKR